MLVETVNFFIRTLQNRQPTINSHIYHKIFSICFIFSFQLFLLMLCVSFFVILLKCCSTRPYLLECSAQKSKFCRQNLSKPSDHRQLRVQSQQICTIQALGTRSKVSVHSRSNWKLEMLVFVEEGTRRKTHGAGTRTNNKINPHMTSSLGIEPGPHWREASALTTAPSLLPQKQ